MNNFFKNIFCLLFFITILANISSMGYLQNNLRRRNNAAHSGLNKLEAGLLYENNIPNLNEIIVGGFEDHQLAAHETLKNIVPGKIFPDEIWREIIKYLDFNDPALIRFFAPIIGVTKEQTEKIAIEIYYYVTKNALNLENIDLKLKSILDTYNKKTQELIRNYITLIDPYIDQEYKNLKYTVGLMPIRWLLKGPNNVNVDMNNQEFNFISNVSSYYESVNTSGRFEIKVNLKIKDITSLKKVYPKLKKRNLMYKYFGSEKYNKILEKYRENFIRNLFWMLFSVFIVPLIIFLDMGIGSPKFMLVPAFLSIYIFWHAFFIVLDSKALSDHAINLEKMLDNAEKLIKFFNKKFAEDKLINRFS